MSQALTQQRLRIQFGKFGALRYVGHLDLATTWERVLRRAEFPLEYTRGFNPRPRLQFATALPVGLTSECELLDVWLTARLPLDPPDALVERLNATSPAGLRTYQVSEVPIKAPALPPQVFSAEYVLTPGDTLSADELIARAEALLRQERIERERRGKRYDLRPLILDLHPDAEGNLVAWLRTGEHEHARADELVEALGLSLADVRVHRRRLVLSEETS
jgi:radical SAM-linked protein